METWFPVCSLYRQERHFEEEKTWAIFQAHKLECFQSLPQLSEKYMFGITESSLFKNHVWHSGRLRWWLAVVVTISFVMSSFTSVISQLPGPAVLWHLISWDTDFQLSFQHHFRDSLLQWSEGLCLYVLSLEFTYCFSPLPHECIYNIWL